MKLRLIHLTDLHIGSNLLSAIPPSHKGFETADSVSLHAVAEKAKYHAVTCKDCEAYCVVTGDITAQGNTSEIESALQYIGSKGIRIRQSSGTLATISLGYPYLHRSVILGNHDVWGDQRPHLFAIFTSSAKGFERARESRKAFHDLDVYEFTGEHTDHPYPYGPEYPRATLFPNKSQLHTAPVCNTYMDIGTTRIRVYQFDTMEDQFYNIFSRGSISGRQLSELDALLASHEKEDRKVGTIQHLLRIAVTHHPVLGGSPLTGLDEARKIALRLSQHKFALILSGHEHTTRQEFDRKLGLHQIVCASSTQAHKRKQSRTNNVILSYEFDEQVYAASNNQACCRCVLSAYTRRYEQNEFASANLTAMRLTPTLDLKLIPLYG